MRSNGTGTVAAILVSALGGACDPNAAAQPLGWGEFAAHPTQDRLSEVEGRIESCRGDVACREASAPTSQEVRQLAALISAGDDLGLRAGFVAMRTLPFAGGDLIDLKRAISGQITSKTKLFLTLAQRYPRDPDLLVVTSSAAIDNDAQRLSEIDARLTAVGAITEDELQDVKRWAAQVLSNERARLSAP
jgi:hypothetical protein